MADDELKDGAMVISRYKQTLMIISGIWKWKIPVIRKTMLLKNEFNIWLLNQIHYFRKCPLYTVRKSNLVFLWKLTHAIKIQEPTLPEMI